MADKWTPKGFFPRIFMYIALLANIAGVVALIILIVTEFIILVNNYQSYVARYGYHYPKDGYLGDYGCGYVEFTNAPKHLGSAIWTLFAQLGLIILCTIAIASDLAWRNTSYNKYGFQYVDAFYAGGIMPGTQNVHIFFFVIANAMLKVYILALYMSQSFYGLNGGSHSDPLRDSSAQTYYTPGNTGVIYDSANAYIRHDGQSNHWKRNDGYIGNEEKPGDWAYYGLIGDRTPIEDMESFAFSMGWVIAATIFPSMVAYIFLSAENAKNVADAKPKEGEA